MSSVTGCPRFDYGPGQPNLYLMMRFKQNLIARHGISDGFQRYRETFGLPQSARLRQVDLQSERAFAAKCARMFVETGRAGEPFVHIPPRVVGGGNHRPIAGVSRSQYVACFDDTSVRGRSALIKAAGHLLLDVQDGEPNSLDDEIDWDPAVFHAEGMRIWYIDGNEKDVPMEIGEAFTLLGAHTDFFGHWMFEYLPKYVAARSTGDLPDVPVLIDAHMPASHRESLELLFGKADSIVEVPAFTSVRVGRLWCAPTLSYMPVHDVRNERFRWEAVSASPTRFAGVIKELQKQFSLRPPVPQTVGPRVYLARKPFRHRRLTNSDAIQHAARTLGFEIVYPEDLSFSEQATIVQNADVVVAPEGSAIFLCFFARPDSRLCILSHPWTDALTEYNGLLAPHGVEVVALTGPITRANHETLHDSDYEIDEKMFRRVVQKLIGPIS